MKLVDTASLEDEVSKLSNIPPMNSLIISDKEKYGEDSPSVCIPASPGEKSKPEERKSAPTFDLVGPQVTAFGLDDGASVGKVYTVKVQVTVKAISDGDKYSSDVVVNSKPKKPKTVTVQVIAASPVSEDEDMSAEDTEAAEDTEDTEAAGEEESAEEEKALPAKKKPKKSESPDYVSPSDADLPE